MTLPNKDYLRPDEVADFLRYTPRHVRRLVESRKLIGFKLGKRSMRILRSSVFDYIESVDAEYQLENGIEDITDNEDRL